MNEELFSVDIVTYRGPDPAAVRALASSVAPEVAAQQRRLVLAYIRTCGAHGATREEIEQALGLNPNSVSPRVWELAGQDRQHPGRPLIASTTRRRRGPQGRRGTVYIAL